MKWKARNQDRDLTLYELERNQKLRQEHGTVDFEAEEGNLRISVKAPSVAFRTSG